MSRSSGGSGRAADRADAGRAAGAETDAELVRRSRAGQDGAFDELVHRHQDRVYRLCLRLLGDTEDANDAAQDAFLQAFRAIGKFRGEAAFSTWLYRITVNACHSLRRRRGPVVAIGLGAPDPDEPSRADPGPPLPDHAAGVASTMDTAAALTAVPEELRAALVLADVEDLPYVRIAEILGVPLGTVKSRVHRGRVALGRVLAASGEPGGAPGPSEGTR